jgi:cell division protein FtsB
MKTKLVLLAIGALIAFGDPALAQTNKVERDRTQLQRDKEKLRADKRKARADKRKLKADRRAAQQAKERAAAKK